jgi:hypothetical protein
LLLGFGFRDGFSQALRQVPAQPQVPSPLGLSPVHIEREFLVVDNEAVIADTLAEIVTKPAHPKEFLQLLTESRS